MEHTSNRSRRSEYTFCPLDGNRLESITRPDGRRLPTCGRCGFVDYGNPKPCVAVLIVQQGQLLLARRGVEPAKGMWDIPGGFIDGGETAEEAAVREMLEETGLQVKITQYLGSLSDTYGDRAEPTLNLCFLAAPCRGILSPQSDVAELQWFLPSELPRTMAFAHQYQVLQRWLDTLRPGVPYDPSMSGIEAVGDQ
jgi:NAD+ diphosphatase